MRPMILYGIVLTDDRLGCARPKGEAPNIVKRKRMEAILQDEKNVLQDEKTILREVGWVVLVYGEA